MGNAALLGTLVVLSGAQPWLRPICTHAPPTSACPPLPLARSRFLQGPDTDRAAVLELKAAIRAGRECTVRLLHAVVVCSCRCELCLQLGGCPDVLQPGFCLTPAALLGLPAEATMASLLHAHRCACSTTPRRASRFGTCSLWRPSSEWPGCLTPKVSRPSLVSWGQGPAAGCRRRS